MSAQEVCDLINNQHGTTVNKRSVQRYVKEGKVGYSPCKKGPDGGIPEEIIQLLLGAVESYVEINQANADGAWVNSRKYLRTILNGVIKKIHVDRSENNNCLLNRLLRRSEMCSADPNWRYCSR